MNRLFHSRHNGRHDTSSILLSPQTGNGFGLGVEMYALVYAHSVLITLVNVNDIH